MEISKKSWHYRLNDSFRSGFDYQTQSLCWYFWSTMFFSFLTLIGSTVFLISLLSPIFVFTGLFRFFEITPFWFGLLDVGVTIFLIVNGILLFIMGLVWITVLNDTGYFKKDTVPGLIVSYLSAKKNKVCPILEFKD